MSLARPGERHSDAVPLGAGGVTTGLAADFPLSPISAPPHRRSRLATVLASLLVALGILVLADAVVTLAWQEPISALLAQLKQESLGSDLRALDRAPLCRRPSSSWRACTSSAGGSSTWQTSFSSTPRPARPSGASTSDVSVLDPVGYSRLVLSACTPLFSASHRLIVFARLSSTAPLDAARIPFDSGRAGRALGPEPVLPTVLKPRQRLLAPFVS